MKYPNILLTGGSGKLGTAIIKSKIFSSLLVPSRNILDITNSATTKNFFDDNDIDAVIHCAALARMAQCEKDPVKAIKTNIIGTSNLVTAVMKKEEKLKKSIRFIYISTDGVYSGTKGNYSEQDPTIPYNKYGWTKLGAEGVVNLLSNFCIIRTRFFDPDNIPFNESAVDAYTSSVPVNYLVKSIAKMIENDFVGTINIGGERKSDYDLYRVFNNLLKPCKLKDILKDAGSPMAKDASMNTKLWKTIENKDNKIRNE